MSLHAETKEREILDSLLTDPAIKQFLGRQILEDLIERIAGDLVLENDELKSQINALEDELKERKDAVATYIASLKEIQRITHELAG